MKKLIISTLAAILILPFTAFAADEPPTVDLGGILEAIDNANQNNDQEAPPSVNLPDIPAQNQGISISSVLVEPEIFNPLVQEMTIQYRLSATAQMEVEIFNALNEKVITLVNNQIQSAGQQQVKWKGTRNNQISSEIVPTGQYRYKLTAKNPNNGLAVDVKEGNIAVQYAAARPSNQAPLDDFQANATLALQNTPTGTTAETGPGIALYGLLPMAGYYFARKYRTW